MAYWFQVLFFIFYLQFKDCIISKKKKKSQLNFINIAASPTLLLSLNSLNTTIIILLYYYTICNYRELFS